MKLTITTFFIAIFISLFSLFSVSPALAAIVTPEGNCGSGKIDTAIGCISTSVETSGDSFFLAILRVAVGLGGGLALLLMLYGVFIVTTSAGMPDKLKEGQEIITSAVSGLLFIILSIFLLNLIGITILGIPGLS